MDTHAPLIMFLPTRRRGPNPIHPVVTRKMQIKILQGRVIPSKCLDNFVALKRIVRNHVDDEVLQLRRQAHLQYSTKERLEKDDQNTARTGLKHDVIAPVWLARTSDPVLTD